MTTNDAKGPLNLTSDQELPPAMTPGSQGVTVDGGLGKARAWFIFGQVLAAAGAIIAFMGLGQQTWVVKTYNFLHSDQAIPLVGLVLWLGGSVGLWWRAKGRQKLLSFFAAITDDRIAKVSGALHPDVQASVTAAMARLPTGQPPVTESRR